MRRTLVLYNFIQQKVQHFAELRIRVKLRILINGCNAKQALVTAVQHHTFTSCLIRHPPQADSVTPKA